METIKLSKKQAVTLSLTYEEDKKRLVHYIEKKMSDKYNIKVNIK